MRIRPHHLLCMPRFEGKGYSEEFCKNMADIITKIKNGEEYEIVYGADSVCKSCPNLVNGKCKDEEKVNRYDKNVQIGKENDISKICFDCQWYNICKNKKPAWN